jgi:hypothetical protein
MLNYNLRSCNLQDVILRKVLDDATLKSLNTIIHANNAFVSVITFQVDLNQNFLL